MVKACEAVLLRGWGEKGASVWELKYICIKLKRRWRRDNAACIMIYGMMMVITAHAHIEGRILS